LGWNDFELRSYDPQIGRFLQHDPYDEFASGYIGMGNDPANLTDPNGGCTSCWGWVQKAVENMGTLQPVTVFAQQKSILNTAVGVGTIITRDGQRIGAQIINQAKPSFLNRTFNVLKSVGASAWNFIKGVGPVLGRVGSVAGGLLIPISTGPGASFSPEQMYERIHGKPELHSDEYLAGAEERMNSGNALPNDWLFAEEIQRRKTARGNGNGDSENEVLGKYTNPGTHDPDGGELDYNPGKTVIPKNHEELWENSKPDPNNNLVRWTKEGKGNKAVYHRFSGNHNNVWHFSGSSFGKTKSGKIRTIPVSNDVKKLWKN
jgi:hypothetical protein